MDTDSSSSRRQPSKRGRTAVAALAAAVAMSSGFGYGTVSADPAIRRAYTNPSGYGNGVYQDLGTHWVRLFAYDAHPDGQRVVVTFLDAYGHGMAEVHDANGADNGCVYKDAYLPNGSKILGQACRRNGGDKATENHCGAWTTLGYS